MSPLCKTTMGAALRVELHMKGGASFPLSGKSTNEKELLQLMHFISKGYDALIPLELFTADPDRKAVLYVRPADVVSVEIAGNWDELKAIELAVKGSR